MALFRFRASSETPKAPEVNRVSFDSHRYRRAVRHNALEELEKERELEINRNPEQLKGRLGLDFVFDERDHPYCIEINGMYSGIQGIQHVDTRHISEDQKALALSRESGTRPANANPPWLEAITENKRRQRMFIPERNYPGPEIGNQAARLEDQQLLVQKPSDGAKGRGVVIQKFIKSRGADRAPENLKGHPASLRLDIDFRVSDNNEIILEEVWGYQRVSPYSYGDIDKTIDGKRVELEDVLVVNLARGAKPVAWSARERKAAIKIALEIIKNFATYNKTRPGYIAEATKALEDQVRTMKSALWDQYQISASLSSSDLKQRLLFLQKIFSELKTVDREKLKKKTSRNSFQIEQQDSPDELIALLVGGGFFKNKKRVIDLKRAGALRKALKV